ncbi:MAG: hypothetical protein EPN26_11945 [Rhodospirillales bacterium]|nr:MAG: hypothetical protein EPN26_11945 [Rhodospirillales bacterium]
MFSRVLTCVLVAFALVACTYRGGGDDPGVRKFSYFSMLNGDDIRDRCMTVPGYERYRIVYNGLYEEQVRIYELVRGPKDGHVLKASVTDAANVAEIDLKDLLSPWRPKVSERFLKDGEFADLTGVLAEAGLFKGAPKGLDLPSDAFWWLAVGCRQGQVYFAAWRHPQPDLTTLPFVKPLLGFDDTRARFNPPRHPISHMPHQKSSKYDPSFMLKVGENGLY